MTGTQEISVGGATVIGQGTWVLTSGSSVYSYLRNSSAANADNITFNFECCDGTYTLIVYHLKSTTGAIVSYRVDGVEKASFDHYGGSTTYGNRDTQTGIVLTSGFHTLTLYCNGKSAGTGYECAVHTIVLARTG